MVADTVTDLSCLINQQIASREVLREHLSKLTSLMHVAMEGDFLSRPQRTAYYFLWVVTELSEDSHKLNEQALTALRKMRTPTSPQQTGGT